MSGFFTRGRVATLAGIGLAAAGTVYFLRTEQGRQFFDQTKERAREALAKMRPETDAAANLAGGDETAIADRTPGLQHTP